MVLWIRSKNLRKMTDDKENSFENTEKSYKESRIAIEQTSEELEKDIETLRNFIEEKERTSSLVRKDEDPENLPRLFF